MKSLFLAVSVFAFSLLGSHAATAETLGYPSADKASFAIDYPDDWEMEPGENIGDYVTLTSPTGVSLQLRTIPGTDTAIDEAVEESSKFLRETFTDVEMGDVKEIQAGGLNASLVLGTGTDSDKQSINFAIYLIALPDGTMADIWYAAFKGDTKGGKAAAEILNSFRTP